MFILGTAVGLTINMISLFGMILVIGILVDDGIVIAENIYSHFEKTGNPVKAAINGTMEVLPAVFTSVTTTIVAFTPLLLLTGGFEFLRDMAYVVIFSLGFSLLEAFFVLPAHLASKKVLSIKKEDTRSFKIRKALNKGIDFFRFKLYGGTLKYTMEYKWVSFTFLICLFVITSGLFQSGAIKATFFPQIPFNSVNINVAFKPGASETQTEKYVMQFDKQVWELNDELKAEYKMEEDNDQVRLVRSKAAKKFDRNVIIFSAVLVLLFPLSFLMMYISGEQVPESELNTNVFILLVIAAVGLLLGVRAGARIDQNNHKKLETTGDEAVYSIKGDILCSITDPNNLQVVDNGDHCQLVINNDQQDFVVIDAHSSNAYFLQTLQRVREIFINQL